MAAEPAPSIVGWNERVRLYPGGIMVEAKLDTGANTSSIDASDVSIYRKNGLDRVRFKFTNNQNKSIAMDRPVRRIARVKDLTGPTQERAVVRLGICIGTTYKIADFTLFDRDGFDFRLLVGRRLLRQLGAAVAANQRYTHEPVCENVKSP